MILYIIEHGTYELGESSITNPIFVSFDYNEALEFFRKRIKWNIQNNNYKIKENNCELEFIYCINVLVYHYKLIKVELI